MSFGREPGMKNACIRRVRKLPLSACIQYSTVPIPVTGVPEDTPRKRRGVGGGLYPPIKSSGSEVMTSDAPESQIIVKLSVGGGIAVILGANARYLHESDHKGSERGVDMAVNANIQEVVSGT
jgi:hypothetical protein